MTSTSKKDNTQKKDNKIQYQYSIKLSTNNHNKKNEQVSKDNKHIDTEKQPLAKVATAQIPINQSKQKPDIKLDTPPPKRNLPTTFVDTARLALNSISKHGINIAAKKFLDVGDKFISFIILKNQKNSSDVVSKARPPIVFGLWVIFFTFFIGGIWSGFAPLDSSSHAQGFVVVSSKKQTVQHRDGGIIEAIYVKEGEHVHADQPLIKLSDTAAKAQLEGLKAQKESVSKQLELLQTQLKSMNELFEKGFVQKDKLIQLQSHEAQAIGNLSELDSRILTAEESLSRMTIRAPVAGTVNQLQVHTIGGSVSPGMILMTITPKEDDLIVEAYVAPQDIDSIHKGLPAKVQISAFKSRTTAPLNGIVTHVSSDVVEPSNQQHSQETSILQQKGAHYKVLISIDKIQLRKISKHKDLELQPGMTASVMIVTGERTLLQYLLDPVTNTFWHAFIEK